MKNVFLIFLTIFIVGCQQSSFMELVARKHFEEANKKLATYMAILDNPYVDKNDKEEVLCLEYPKIYRYEYLPAILRLNKLKVLNAKPKDQLLDDLLKTTESYSDKLNITCD